MGLMIAGSLIMLLGIVVGYALGSIKVPEDDD